MYSKIRLFLFASAVILISGVLNGTPFQKKEQSEKQRSTLDEITKSAKAQLDQLNKEALNQRDLLYNKLRKELPNIAKEEVSKIVSEQLSKGPTPPATGEKSLRNTSAFKDPGPPLEIGKGGLVPLGELAKRERIIAIGGDNLLPITFLEAGVTASKAVGRVTFIESVTLNNPIRTYGPGDAYGTGFLVAESLFITNNHVIPTKEFAKKIEVQFNVQNDTKGRPLPIDPFAFDPDSFFLTLPELDFTLIRLKPRDYPREGITSQYPGATWGTIRLTFDLLFAPRMPLNIIQHPKGRAKEIALQDNNLVTLHNDVLLYTTDTDQGSSGSPVFNNSWQVIGLHNSAGEKVDGEYINNQGIRIDRIVQYLKSTLGADARGLLILQELGLQ
jgi:V8-like Glu-specific endopeptidase